MKKLISFIMIIVMLCTSTISFAQGNIYEPSDWAVEYVEYAYSVGLIDVKQQYEFITPITRLEFCEMAYVAVKKHMGIDDTDIELPSPFTDVDSQAVTVLNYAGIINGKSATEFAPNDYLTREEAATIVVRTVDFAGGVNETKTYFDFADGNTISDWASSSVQRVCNMGLMIGVGDNKFAPKQIYTTEQAITTLVRAFKKLK